MFPANLSSLHVSAGTKRRLNNNSLTTLPEDIFQDLTGLQDLSLGDNALATLPEGVFRNLAALGEL